MIGAPFGMTRELPFVATSPGRHFGLDWLRVAAFALLIFYHIGMVFAPGDWMIKSTDIVEAAAWPMVLLQPWRMPLLFAVSGYASYALLAKSGDLQGFARLRSRRLLLPLLFGTLFIVPPQWWAEQCYDKGYQASLLHFWWYDWLSFGNRPGNWMPDTTHLWFVAYLWTYTMVLVVLVWSISEPMRHRLTAVARWLGKGKRLLWAPLVPLLLLRLGLLFTVPEVHGAFHDWVSDATFLPPFLFGFALAANPSWWAGLRRTPLAASILALITGSIILLIEMNWPDGEVLRSHAIQALQRESSLVMAWSMVLLLLYVADRWLNHDHKWRTPLCEAVFPFYIIHQTIIVMVAWAVNVRHVPNGPAFVLLAMATFGGCWLFYRFALISGTLREWLGLGPARKAASALQPVTS